jgi:hypothetical protein
MSQLKFRTIIWMRCVQDQWESPKNCFLHRRVEHLHELRLATEPRAFVEHCLKELLKVEWKL